MSSLMNSYLLAVAGRSRGAAGGWQRGTLGTPGTALIANHVLGGGWRSVALVVVVIILKHEKLTKKFIQVPQTQKCTRPGRFIQNYKGNANIF